MGTLQLTGGAVLTLWMTDAGTLQTTSVSVAFQPMGREELEAGTRSSRPVIRLPKRSCPPRVAVDE